MEEYALTKDRLMLVIDEADHLLGTRFYNDFFGMLRAWHNRASYDKPWDKLNIVVAVATDPWLFIQNINQSPFDVGLKLALNDFNKFQVRDLNQRYGSPVSDKNFPRLIDLPERSSVPYTPSIIRISQRQTDLG